MKKKNGWAFLCTYTKDVATDGMVGVCHKTGEIGHHLLTEAARQGYGAKMLVCRKSCRSDRYTTDDGVINTNTRHRCTNGWAGG